MKLTRTLFFLLLATNIVLAILLAQSILGLGLYGQSGEPDRLTRQLAPERIRIQPLEEDKRTAPPAPTADASTPVAAAVSANQSTPAAEDKGICLALKGLTQTLSKDFRDAAGPLGEKVTLRETGVNSSSYWVHIPPGGGKDGADKRVEILKQAEIGDFFVVRDAGNNQFAISLGLYRNEEAAQRRLEALTKKGIKTARIATRDNTGTNARVEISGPPDLVEKLAEEFASSHKEQGIQRDECQPG